MSFANPPMLGLLVVVVPLLAVFLAWGWRKKQSLIAQFIRSRLRVQLTIGVSKKRQFTRLTLLVATIALVFLALARPRWGYRLEEVRQKGLDILVAIDTSRSMLAEDVAPNRLRRAKLAALDLMRQAKTDRLGLVAFAGTAFLQCPLTLDDEAFRQSVDTLDTGIIPQEGTALAEAIRTALRAHKDAGENFQTLVLITDGEDHEPGALEAAQEAATAGMRIFTVGVGSAEGERLLERDESGVTRFIKGSDGNAITSRLNEPLLRQIAQTANGFYVPLRGANIMEQLYEKGLAPLPKSEYSERLMRQYYERFQWPLGLAILLLLIETLFPEHKLVRQLASTRQTQSPIAAQALICWVLIGLAWPAPSQASPAGALRLYRQGKFAEAQKEYQRLLQANTNDARLQLNAGIAAYQAEHYSQATNLFNEAAQAPDLHWQQQAYYNLGNALYRAGENNDALKRPLWEQAVKSYQNALSLNKQDTNAQYNLEFVRKRIEALPQPPPQPSPQNQPQQNPTNSPPQEPKPQSQPNPNEGKDQQKSEPQPNRSQDQRSQSNPSSSEPKKPDSSQTQSQPQSKESETPEPSQAKAQSSTNESPASPTGNSNQAATSGQVTQMTPEQALRLLDAQKADEKALNFAPLEKRDPTQRIYKNW